MILLWLSIHNVSALEEHERLQTHCYVYRATSSLIPRRSEQDSSLFFLSFFLSFILFYVTLTLKTFIWLALLVVLALNMTFGVDWALKANDLSCCPCREDVRTANIIAADSKGVDCLVIDRE